MFIKSWSEIDNKSAEYYKKIIELCKKKSLPDNLSFIVVDHCLQTFESHVSSLSKLGKISGVILKGSTRHEEAEKFANNHYKIISVTKDELNNSKIAIKTILENTSRDDKLIILDHGGYFAASLKEIVEHDQISKQFLGLIEVTENGHVKLEQAIKKTKLPAISIARSEIKELEDIQVGISICDVTNNILYSIHSALTSLNSVCVIGYGKIGRSIANHCRRQRIPTITVIEIDSLRAQLALKEGHKVVIGKNNRVDKISAFQNAQIIFSATGAKALSKSDVPFLRRQTMNNKSDSHKRVLYIASCTSPDEEFSPDFFSELLSLSKNAPTDRLSCEKDYKFTPYELYDGRQINILNGGKAVNFAMGGTPGYEICQVWAAVLYAASTIAAGEIKEDSSIQTLSHEAQSLISDITHTIFLSDAKISTNENIQLRCRSNSFPSGNTKVTLFSEVNASVYVNEPSQKYTP